MLTGIGLLISRRLAASEHARLETGTGLDGLWPAGRLAVGLQAAMTLILVIALAIPLLSLLTAALVPTYGVGLSLQTLTLDNFMALRGKRWVEARARSCFEPMISMVLRGFQVAENLSRLPA